MTHFMKMKGPYPEAEILNMMGCEIDDLKTKYASIGEFDIKPIAYIGLEQWKALHGIHPTDMQCTKGHSQGELLWMGTRMIRTFKDDYFHLVNVD